MKYSRNQEELYVTVPNHTNDVGMWAWSFLVLNWKFPLVLVITLHDNCHPMIIISQGWGHMGIEIMRLYNPTITRDINWTLTRFKGACNWKYKQPKTKRDKYKDYQWEVIWPWCVGRGLTPSKLSFSKYFIQILWGNCTRTRHGQQWPVNGANIEIFSNCFCMHWNLTWIDYSHALMIWESFWTQIWLTHPLSSIINSSCKP